MNRAFQDLQRLAETEFVGKAYVLRLMDRGPNVTVEFFDSEGIRTASTKEPVAIGIFSGAISAGSFAPGGLLSDVWQLAPPDDKD